MAVKSSNLGPTATSAVLATGPATLHNIHWVSATAGTGTVQFHDGTSTGGAIKMILDTPDVSGNKGAAADMRVGGGGMKFSTAIFGKVSNSGGVTIVYATGI